MNQNTKQFILKETEKLLAEIQEKQMPDMSFQDLNIDSKIQILESIIYKRPLNINAYTNVLVPITTKEKCVNCHRIASYMIVADEKKKLCWTHSQSIN